MRILHVAESVKGGCGTYLNQLVRTQLADPSIEQVHVVAPDAHIVQIPDIPENNRSLFISRGRSPASLLSLWRTTAKTVQQFQPDCVHLHSTFAGAMGRLGLAFDRHRPPVVYCAHGWAFDMTGSAAKRAITAKAERFLSRSCEGVIAISEYERRRGIEVGIDPNRIVTVLNGIDHMPPSPRIPIQSAARRRVLFIGRLDRQKGIDLLLKAIGGLEDQMELRIIGSPVVGDQTFIDLERPGVTALGWCDDQRIQQELSWAECVVIPSRWEGFGLVALEAMRAGRAVIATNVGGLPEVVEDGRTGWLIRPECPSSLRAALLSPDNAQLAAAGEAGRQRFVQHFTMQRTASALSAVYRQAIAMRGSISHAFA